MLVAGEEELLWVDGGGVAGRCEEGERERGGWWWWEEG